MAASIECGTTLIIFYLTSSKAWPAAAWRDCLNAGMHLHVRTRQLATCDITSSGPGTATACMQLTNWKSSLKARLEGGHAESGRRGAGQVLANSALGAALAAACAWQRAGGGASLFGWPASLPALVCGFVGFYACCCADTWSSEVGMAATAQPRLVTTWRRVPHGTNGGVTALGTVAAGAGGALVGCTFLVCALLLRVLGLGSGDGSTAAAAALACWQQVSTDWRLLPLALVAGLAGSLFDSLLGATLQLSLFDENSRKAVPASWAAALGQPGSRPAANGTSASVQLKRICGRNVLSNTGVNVCSSVLTAALAAAAGPRLLPPCAAA